MPYVFPRRGGYIKSTTASTVITTIGNILSVQLTELARLAVPSLPVPIKLEAHCVHQNNGAGGVNLDSYIGIAPAGAPGVSVAAALAIASMGEINIGGTTTEPPGRTFRVSYWLPENSPGDYILGAWRETGSDAGNVIANSLVPLEFEWVRG